MNSRNGSGANGTGISDDSQMPRLVPVEELFKGRHFNREIVVLCVRWYWSFKLSYRDLVAAGGWFRIECLRRVLLILQQLPGQTPDFLVDSKYRQHLLHTARLQARPVA
jgi:hypothetical protein